MFEVVFTGVDIQCLGIIEAIKFCLSCDELIAIKASIMIQENMLFFVIFSTAHMTLHALVG